MADDDSIKNRPEEQVYSSAPMTDVQRISLDTLSGQTGEPTPDDHLTDIEAAQRIAELREEARHDDTNTDDQDEP